MSAETLQHVWDANSIRLIGDGVPAGDLFAAKALFLAAWLGLKFVPVPEALLRTPPVSLELTDRNGKTLRETRVGERFRREVGYPEIPSNLVHAMLAAEDKRFFSHLGVDWLAAGRAAVSSARAAEEHRVRRRFRSSSSSCLCRGRGRGQRS